MLNTSQHYFVDWWFLTRFFWIIIALGLVYAWRQGWPRWSGSWLGFLLVLVIDLLVNLFPEGVLGGLAIGLFFLLSWLLIYRLALIDPMQSLLSIPPASTLWLWYISLGAVQGVITQGFIFLWCGLILALAGAQVERQKKLAPALAWLAGAIVFAGLPVAVGEIFFSSLTPASAPTPSIWNFFSRLLSDGFLPFFLGLPLWFFLVPKKER